MKVKLSIDVTTNIIEGYETILPNTMVFKDDIIVEDENSLNLLLTSDISLFNLQYNRSNGTITKLDNAPETITKQISDQNTVIRKLTKLTAEAKEKVYDAIVFGKDNIDTLRSELTESMTALENANKKIAELVSTKETLVNNYHKDMIKSMDASINPSKYVSIVLVIRDENRYLDEWVRYHYPLCDHIYIYDNGKTESVNDVISAMSKADQRKITVIEWKDEYKNIQEDAYNHYLEEYGWDSRWCLFIDSDEFIKVNSGKTLAETLKGLEEYTSVELNFVEYNANGLHHYENKPVRERFTNKFNEFAKYYRKSAVQPVRIDCMARHYPVFSSWHKVYNDATKELFNIEHYYTKSYEEWVNKMTRGSVDPDYLKKFNEFFAYNPDLVSLKVPDESIPVPTQSYNV